jgi:hypothetical protein
MYHCLETAMIIRLRYAASAAAIGLVYWSVFATLSAVNEPWDGKHYWSIAYPMSLFLAAGIGFMLKGHTVIVGVSVTFAQLPLIVLNSGPTFLAIFSVAILGILSVPVIGLAYVGSALRLRA